MGFRYTNKDCPCNGCTERCNRCHASCIRYRKFKRKIDVENSQRRKIKNLELTLEDLKANRIESLLAHRGKRA